MAELAIIPIEQQIYSENLLPIFCNFDTEHFWNILSGTGVVEEDENTYFAGNRSVLVTKNNYNIAPDLVFNSGSDEMETEVFRSGNYMLSFYVLIAEAYISEKIPFNLKLFKNGAFLTDLSVVISEENGYQFGKWNRLVQQISLNIGDKLNYQFEVGSDLTSAFTKMDFNIDGMKLDFNDKGMTFPPLYFPVV